MFHFEYKVNNEALATSLRLSLEVWEAQDSSDVLELLEEFTTLLKGLVLLLDATKRLTTLVRLVKTLDFLLTDLQLLVEVGIFPLELLL